MVTDLIIEVIPCEFVRTPFVGAYKKLVIKARERWGFTAFSCPLIYFLRMLWPISKVVSLPLIADEDLLYPWVSFLHGK